MSTSTSISFLSTLLSWGLAIFLGTQLLSGTFDGRTCQTTCVNTVFWASFVIAVIGLVFGIAGTSTGRSGWIRTLSLITLAGLCGIYVTTMLVGTFGI